MNMHDSEPIAVIFDSEGALYRFHWRGLTFRVEAIERIRRTAASACTPYAPEATGS